MQGNAKKIGINYKALVASCAIVTVGSVPSLQTYQADINEYTPDYTLTPLTLLPNCTATNPDRYTASSSVNSQITNMKWYEQVGSTKTLITSSNLNYVITDSGSEKGKIVMKRNSHTLNPVTLVFEAEYVDSRDGKVYYFRASKLVNCMDATPATPTIYLDSPTSLPWNPLRDSANQAITAKIIVAGVDVTESDKCKLFFYRLLSTGAHELVTTTGDNDWEVVSLTKNVLTINRDLIGDKITYIVKASYSADSNPASEPTDDIPVAITTITRSIPKLESDWQMVQSGVAEGTTSIYPVPVIRDNQGVLDNNHIKEWIKCVWSTKAPASSSYTKTAEGYAPSIPMIANMMLKLDIEDRGAKVLVTTSGKVITVGGKALIVRKY